MIRVTDLAHFLLGPHLTNGDWVVDATVGNGHDTCFLAECVGRTGRVFGFDVQQSALAVASERVKKLPQVTLIHAGHEELADRLPDAAQGQIAVFMFNLGYLPGAHKDITTRTETTLSALDQALNCLKCHGLISLVLYPGHCEGAKEAEAVKLFAQRLSPAFSVTQHGRLNSAGPAPELLLIERLH